MQKTSKKNGGFPPLLIVVGLTLACFLLYFAIHSAVQNRFQILYTTSAEAGVWAVSGYSKPTEELKIPAAYQGLPVGHILSGSFSYAPIRTLTLEAVTNIGSLAFRSCEKLEQITFGKVEEIGDNAFEFCKSLTGITLPESVSRIGKRAFSFCDKLESVYFLGNPDDLGENIFQFCPNVVVYGPAGGSVEAYCAQYGLPFQPLPVE